MVNSHDCLWPLPAPRLLFRHVRFAPHSGRSRQYRSNLKRSLAGPLCQKTRRISDRFRQTHSDVVQACLDVFLKNNLEPYAKTCRMLGAMDLRHDIAAIRFPTRILVGAEDYATPPE